MRWQLFDAGKVRIIGVARPEDHHQRSRRVARAIAELTLPEGNGLRSFLEFLGTPAVALLLAVIVAAATFAIVPETKQAVVYRFEQPRRIVNGYRPGETLGESGAGLIARIPFIDRIVWVDKRVLDLDLENTQVLSTDQLRMNVDAFARFRVVDPRRMLATAGSEEGVANQLRPIFGSALRNELGKRRFSELLSPERGEVMDAIQVRLDRIARQYGVQIVDVRIKEAELPQGTPLESALRRMQTARQQEAGERLRADYERAQLSPTVTMRWRPRVDGAARAAPDLPSGAPTLEARVLDQLGLAEYFAMEAYVVA